MSIPSAASMRALAVPPPPPAWVLKERLAEKIKSAATDRKRFTTFEAEYECLMGEVALAGYVVSERFYRQDNEKYLVSW